MESLRRNFRAEDFLQLLEKTDSRMKKWLERKGETELSEEFEKISKKHADETEITAEAYLDLLKVFFSVDFENESVHSLHDVLKFWRRKYTPENDGNMKYLLDFICRNMDDCKKVYRDYPVKLTVGKYFDLCREKEETAQCLSIFEKHPDWVDCEQVFSIASDLYWKNKKPEHLFVVAKLLIEKLTKGENQQVGISCLKKAIELKYQPAIDYVAKDGPQTEMIAQSADGCKILYEHYPTKQNFGLCFAFCLKSVRKNESKDDFKRCLEMWKEHPDWIDHVKLFDIASDTFWKTQEPQYVFVVARLLIEKFRGKENEKVGGECMRLAAKQNYQPAVDYLNQKSLSNRTINLDKEDSKSKIR